MSEQQLTLQDRILDKAIEFARWLFDDSANQRKSKDVLNTALRQWQRVSCNKCASALEPAGTEPAQRTPIR